MGDCSNAMMRDQLPDLLHGRLAGAQLSQARAHLETCAECRAELALLTQVRRSAPAPAVDVVRIVAAVPAYAAPSWQQRFLRAPQVRVAAAVLLLAGGAGLALRLGGIERGMSDVDSVRHLALSAPAELALGETFQDVSDSDLRAIVDALDALEAVMPEDPDEIVVPLDSEGM